MINTISEIILFAIVIIQGFQIRILAKEINNLKGK